MTRKRRKTEGPTRSGLLRFAAWSRYLHWCGEKTTYPSGKNAIASHEFVREIIDDRTRGFTVAESLAYSPWNWSR